MNVNRWFVLGVSLLLFGGLALPVYASGSTLSLNPSTTTVKVGDTFQVEVWLNTGGDIVDTVSASIKFNPRGIVKVVGVSSSGSPFYTQIPVDNSDTSQELNLTVVSGQGVQGDQVLVQKLSLEALTAGIVTASFDNSSAVYKVSDLRDNLDLENSAGATYTVSSLSASATATPTPTGELITPTLSPLPTPQVTTVSPTGLGDGHPQLPEAGEGWVTVQTFAIALIFLLAGGGLLASLR